MEDEGTLIHLHATTVRRSAYTADGFWIDLPPNDRSRLPGDILRDAVQPLIDLAARPGGWLEIVEALPPLVASRVPRRARRQRARTLAPGAARQPGGPLRLLARRVVDPQPQDVFGDLQCIDAGADTLANAFAPALLDDTRLGAGGSGGRADAITHSVTVTDRAIHAGRRHEPTAAMEVG